jgi:FAD/FMN-containing dehydrogenase
MKDVHTSGYSGASETYEEKKQRLITSIKTSRGKTIRLAKDTSNLFRERPPPGGIRLNVKNFTKVIRVVPEEAYAEVEGMTTYAELTRECLKHGVMPAVVPQLKSITVGGAVTGIGIESSSFKYGLVHETVREMDILLGDGTTVTCTPENEHRRLFFGFPNSYGTLGYALKLRLKVVPVKPFVRLAHVRHQDAASYFHDIDRRCSTNIDFIDGTVFNQGEHYLTVGEFVDTAPYTSDYTFKNIYYRSIRERNEDYLTVEDYIWRWDTDWFWCSRYIFAQNPLVRQLLGKKRLNSVTYTKIMRLNRKWQLAHHLDRMLGYSSEAVIQDVEIPLHQCPDFLTFYFDTIKFTPVWICPVRAWDSKAVFSLYPMNPAKLYINFGFWNVIRNRGRMIPGYYNRLVEEKVRELGGIKSLYSDSYYPPEQFWAIYNQDEYWALKKRYDPSGKFKDLYEKCVRHQ